jgi:hypothetical protein
MFLYLLSRSFSFFFPSDLPAFLTAFFMSPAAWLTALVAFRPSLFPAFVGSRADRRQRCDQDEHPDH